MGSRLLGSGTQRVVAHNDRRTQAEIHPTCKSPTDFCKGPYPPFRRFATVS